MHMVFYIVIIYIIKALETRNYIELKYNEDKAYWPKYVLAAQIIVIYRFPLRI